MVFNWRHNFRDSSRFMLVGNEVLCIIASILNVPKQNGYEGLKSKSNNFMVYQSFY